MISYIKLINEGDIILCVDCHILIYNKFIIMCLIKYSIINLLIGLIIYGNIFYQLLK